MVEKNELEEIKKLFSENKSLLEDPKNLRAQNGWSPDLFAARFGYTEMLEFFLESVYNSNFNDKKISDLILLNIHSGSLETMYYLQKKTTFSYNDLPHFYINSCKLEKLRLCLYFLIRGTPIIDNIAVNGDQKVLIYYNIYPTEEKDEKGKDVFLNNKGIKIK